MELDGKVAFVTGGFGDIGGAIAISLAKAGVDVAVSYVGDLQRAAATVDAVKKIGRRSLAVQLDQRDFELDRYQRQEGYGRVRPVLYTGSTTPVGTLAFHLET